MWMTYSEPQYLEITDEWREKFERFREEHANDPEGNVADLVLFEDDNLRGVTPKGHPVEPFIGIIPENGNTVPVPKGNTEWAWNVGKKTYHEVLIELKNT